MSTLFPPLPLWADLAVAALSAAGAMFALVGSFGLVKLSTFEKRLHGPTKAATLGLGGVLVASIVHFGVRSHEIPLHELVIVGFVFLTAPIAAHLLIQIVVLRTSDPPSDD